MDEVIVVPPPVEPDPVEPDPEPVEPEPEDDEPPEPVDVSSVVVSDSLVPPEEVLLLVSASVSTNAPVLMSTVSTEPYAGCALTTQPANRPTDNAAPRSTRDGVLQWGQVSPTRFGRRHAWQDLKCMS